MEYPHSCIKCGTQYTDNDPDAYLCTTCNEARKAIAAQVDKSLAMRPKRQSKSLLQQYNEAPKVRGFMVLNAADL